MNDEDERGILEYEDDLLAALQEARALSPDDILDEPLTVTQPEARKIFGLSENKTKAILDGMCESGTLKRKRIGRVNKWGVLNHIPGYKFRKIE